LKDQYAFVYENGKFKCVEKKYAINNVVEKSYWSIVEIYDEIKCDDKLLTKSMVNNHNTFNDKYQDETEEYNTNNNCKYKNFKNYNEKQVTLLLYNISLVLKPN
jgi:hypothetical protein